MELEVVPEQSLVGDKLSLVLGTSLRVVVEGLGRERTELRGLQLTYCAEAPLSRAILVELPEQGLRLAFHPLSQRLASITVLDFTKLSLRYASARFSSPAAPATYSSVEAAFGPTHPGSFDAESHSYVLSWRGLSFAFPAHSPPQPHSASAGRPQRLGSLQLAQGDATGSSVPSRMSIFSAQDPSLPPDPPVPVLRLSHQLLSASLLRSGGATQGVRLSFRHLAHGGVHRLQTTDILLGATTEEIYAALGAPDSTFYKAEDKMRIHRGADSTASLPSPAQSAPHHVHFFANYPALGMDILFDAESGEAGKIILRTNFPGHFDFGVYDRCLIEGEIGGAEVSVETRWEELSGALFKGSEPPNPVVLNRTSSTPNPFGSTFCYGYQDLIFEVIPANGHIASITAFSAKRSL